VTAPAIDVDSIEHLDHTPACEGPRHKADPPPAGFWVDIHGCKKMFACVDCVAHDRAMFSRWGEYGIPCRHCGWYFTTFESAEKVVPL
jgi:hypothetical protein